jgi:hypothetical protein
MIDEPVPGFLTALRRSHERLVRATLMAWSGATLVEIGPMNVSSGTLAIDSTAASWRRLTGQFTVPPETQAAMGSGGVVSTDNTEVKLEMGITMAGSPVYVQIAQLRVEEVRRKAMEAAFDVVAFDRANRVADFPFITPYAPRDMSNNLLTVVGAIEDIITTAFPSATPPEFVVDDSLNLTAYPPEETVFTGARLDAVAVLAESISATVHNDHLGRFVIRSKRPNFIIDERIASGTFGNLTSLTSTSTRVEQYNAVGMSSELPGGEGSIFVYVVDNEPTSPTYYDGPFGRKPFMARNDVIYDEATAILAARAILARKKTAARDVSLNSVYNPLLQPLDGIQVSAPSLGLSELHTVESIDLPLNSGTMSVSAFRWAGTVTLWGELRYGRSWSQVPPETTWGDAVYADQITPP